MLEILVLILGSNKIAEMAENKGHSPLLWRILFIAGWLFGAGFSALIALVITGSGPRGPNFCAAGIGYLIGGLLGIGAVTLALAVWPEPPRERGYMDDYYEYQQTGRVSSYGRPRRPRRPRDDEHEERPRRRPRDDDDEDRPRRRSEDDDRPRRDERYREDDRPRRRDRDDDRPRRPRRDEDY